MRILMWFTVGFVAACALNIFLGFGLWLCVLTVTAVVFLLAEKKRVTRVIATILIGVTVGMLWTAAYDSLYLNALHEIDGKNLEIAATVTDYSFETDYGVAADAQTVVDGKKYKLRLYYPNDTALQPGDELSGSFRFRMTTDDAVQGGAYHQGDGVFLLAYVSEDAAVTPGDPNALRYLGVRLRRSISQTIQKIFPEDTYPFATALILGDSSALNYETDTDFKVSGIRHVIAVSGLHVSILMAVVYIFSGRSRFLSALIGFPVLLLFAAVVGFTPSVVRACIMQGLVLLALLFNKEYDPPTALSFAVLSMLMVNPMTITSVSFQLSCGCIVGIFLFYERIYKYFLRIFKAEMGKSLRVRLIRFLCAGATITICTAITTTPLSAYYFGAVSTVGVLTNLLTLWVISFVFWGIGICCIFAAVYTPLAKLLALAISLPIRYVMGVAKVLATLPFSAVYTCSIYIVIWLVMCYGLLPVFLLSKRKRPLLITGCVVAGLVLSIGLSWLKPAETNYQVTVFDVGQGQSILIESDDRYYLIDCGGDSARVAADTVQHHLLSRGITRLNGVIITHYDADHAGAVPLLLTGISADMLYLPEIEDNGVIKDQLKTSHENIYWVDQYAVLEFENSKLTMIPGEAASNDNERSLCILFQRENCDILITGDRSTAGEKMLQNSIRLPKLDLLVVGHHGSNTSTGLDLLDATRPKAAVISVGKDNNYGNPSADVLKRLKLYGVTVWRTDRDGTIIFKG